MSEKTVEWPESLTNVVQRRQRKLGESAQQRFLRATEKVDRIIQKDPREKIAVRRRIVDDYDSNAIERIIGESDLFPIAYLQTGYRVGDAVCRVVLRDAKGAVVGSGTGFLVAPTVLMTNNHVLESVDTAMRAHVEFHYQDDENFMPRPIFSYRLDPSALFLTDENLDFTLVAVKDNPGTGKNLAEFGHLPLIAETGKILEGEYVSIIQHPSGGPKAVTLRENQVKAIQTDFVHYLTDTEPGSSGSPVFNDQWAVVALHHAGVPDPNTPGGWIANEGIRISSIAKRVAELYPELSSDSKALVKSVFPSVESILGEPAGTSSGASAKGQVASGHGYDELFLGDSYRVAMPQLSAEMSKDVALTEEGNSVLTYTHFSIVMCKSRGLAYFTAVNINGKEEVEIPRSRDKWKFDTRIPDKHQYGNEVYANNDLDRGHLVRRKDPNWGKDAKQANADTFHFTNSAPQHKELNQKTWLELEDYILQNANTRDLQVTVFTGPVFRADDIVYRGKYKIPAEFWKVVVMVKTDGTLSATGYLQTQKNMIDNLEFAYGEYKTYQVPITHLAEITGLDFGELPTFDPIARIESAGRVVTGPDQIVL